MITRTEKFCPRCNQILDISLFTAALGRYDGVQAYCRECMKAYRLESYRKYPEKQRIRNEKTKDRLRIIYREMKSVPCTDCRVQYPFWIMQFDHIGDDKQFEPARLIGQGSESKLRLELAKCEVVCANCHADRTWKRNHEKVLDNDEIYGILVVQSEKTEYLGE